MIATLYPFKLKLIGEVAEIVVRRSVQLPDWSKSQINTSLALVNGPQALTSTCDVRRSDLSVIVGC